LNQGIKRIEAQAGDRKTPEQPPQDVQAATAISPQGEVTTATSGVAATVPLVAAGNEKNLQEEYDRGVAHLQAKEYDKAIERFNRLQRTPMEAKARPQIEEASKLAAQDMRQKAAELFVRATNSRDTDEKRKLLLSSRDLLQSILVKYPQSGLTDKVQKNLARIEAELQAVETGSTPKPATSGGAYVPPKPGGGGVSAPSTSL